MTTLSEPRSPHLTLAPAHLSPAASSVAEAAPAPVLRSEEEAVALAYRYAEQTAPGAAGENRGSAGAAEERAELERSGLLGMTIPSLHGGSGLALTATSEVLRTIAMSDPATAEALQGHFGFVDVLRLLGTDVQQRRLFGDVLRAARLGDAVAERGVKPAQNLRTRLVRDSAGRLRLSGHKDDCTDVLSAPWIAVTALDERDRLVVVFVSRHDDGVCGHANDVIEFDQVRIDPALIVPYWQAFEGPQMLGARAQLGHAAIEVGIAGGALRDAREFLGTRLVAQVQAAEEQLRWAARELTEIGVHTNDELAAARGAAAVARAGAFGSETAVSVASELFGLSGASATDARHALDRHRRYARTHDVCDLAPRGNAMRVSGGYAY